MNRAEYEAMICKQLPLAKCLDFRKVLVKEQDPAVSHCHENVDLWVKENPGHHAVRGWIVYKKCLVGDLPGTELTAHSVVCDEHGDLFDITPIEDERIRPAMRFVQHKGTEMLFFELKRMNLTICCPHSETVI